MLDEELTDSTGHQGMHGHEFLEFEYSNGPFKLVRSEAASLISGRIRYANNSNYRNDSLIRKESECRRRDMIPRSIPLGIGIVEESLSGRRFTPRPDAHISSWNLPPLG
jgi:hypothetical protein